MGRAAVGALMFAGPVILLSIIAAAIVYVRLLHGPISLKAFSVRIENGISAELGDMRAQIDDAVVALTPGRGLEFQLINLRITEADGDLVASAPLAAIELDGGALLLLRAAPTRVSLIEPKLSLLYSEDRGLVLSFADPEADPASAEPPPAQGAPGTSAPLTAPPKPGESSVARTPAPGAYGIDLTRTLAETSRRARRGGNATSYLREIGLRNATVVVQYGGTAGEWKVADAAIDLEHLKRSSIISGAARINSPRGPWTFAFRTEDSEKKGFIRVTSSIRDLVPSTLSQAAPQLSLLETLGMPVSGDLALDLSASGELKEASLTLDLGKGQIQLPGQSNVPLMVDEGQLRLAYDAVSRRLKVAPSTLRWGQSHMTLEGAMTSETAPGGEPQWHFGIKANEGVFAAEEFGVPGVGVDAFTAAGRIVPDKGLVELSEFTLKAGGAEISANGEFATGTSTPGTRVEAVMTPMSLPTLKALWPRAAVPAARMWVGKSVTRANLKAGNFKLVSGSYLGGQRPNDGTKDTEPNERMSMTIEVADLQMMPLADGLPIEAPSALIRLENNVFEVTVPDAALIAGPVQQVPLKGGRFTVVDVATASSVGELAFRTQAPLSALIEALNRSRLGIAGTGDIPAEGIEGKVDGQFKVTMALGTGGSGATPKAEGKARITDIRLKQRVGPFELQGGAVDINISHTGAMATGEVLLNGVLAKVEVQRIFDVPADMQPAMRVVATLDNADRIQLGLDVNHLVQGEVPIEIGLKRGINDETIVHARADLTNAELTFYDLAWRKVPGRAAVMEFEVGKSQTGLVELQNFKVAGDDIAIEGWMSIDDQNEVREFTFPNFSLNLVSRLDVQGKISKDRIWSIKAKGTAYDGKELFQSLLSLGKSKEDEVKPRNPAAGMDLEADIDTVLGYSDVSMRSFKLKLSERNDLLTALDVRGTLGSGKPVAVVLKKASAGARQIYADSADAGEMFKLTGFYPNMQGGRARLEVNLDGVGDAEKSGILWVDDFRVLGDAVISEVYSSVGATGGPAIDATPQGQRRVVREVFDFDRLKVPFSLGHGQFVMDEAYVKGAALGASIRGKVDYTTRRMSLGGTYVPLQGLNAALCDIPLVGPIVAGLECEGIFGITYAIQGPMAQPQVIVNPLSMLTPGIFRGIMEMTNPNPKVLRRAEQPKADVEQRVRNSSSAVSGQEIANPDKDGTSQADAIDGWSSETAAPRPKPAKPPKNKQ